jgi:hypothetical protein
MGAQMHTRTLRSSARLRAAACLISIASFLRLMVQGIRSVKKKSLQHVEKTRHKIVMQSDT